MSSRQQVIAEINKKYGEGTLEFASQVKIPEVQRIPTGSLFLDKQLGTNAQGDSGWPLGRIVELYGPQMSGKSTLALKTIAEAQKQGLKGAYFDAEKSFDIERVKMVGVDPNELLVSTETLGEMVLETIGELLKSGAFSVIVIDSLAALVPMAEMEKSLMDTNRMALVAALMSQALRKLTALNDQTLVIFINQLRVNPGQTYGNPEYTPGGKALGFYASVRVDLRTGEWIINKKKEKIGQLTKFKITKNKTAPPHRTGYYKLMYNGDIDKVDELISLGLLQGGITRKGGYYFIGDSEDGIQGQDKLEALLKKDKKLFEKAKKVVFK